MTVAAYGASAQESGSVATDTAPAQGIVTTDVTEPQPLAPTATNGGNEWVVAPIPTLNPSQGYGLQVIGQYIFGTAAADADAKPSVLAAGGFYTEKDSWGAFAGYLGHLKDDQWRALVGGGYMSLNYDFYGTGNQLADLDLAIPIEQTASFGAVQLLHRVIPHLYAGVRLLAYETDIASKGVDRPPVTLPPAEHNTSAYASGAIVQWDSRDNQFFPTRGQLANASAVWTNGDHSYETYELEWNLYAPLGKPSRVLAMRAYLGEVSGDAPFYALMQFGWHNDLRGYESGKFRDSSMFATQLEYRGSLGARWGYVAFAGVGEVAPSIGKMNTDDLLSSAGVGVRLRLAKNNPVNLRLDWAYGKDGDAVYLAVGEAF